MLESQEGSRAFSDLMAAFSALVARDGTVHGRADKCRFNPRCRATAPMAWAADNRGGERPSASLVGTTGVGLASLACLARESAGVPYKVRTAVTPSTVRIQSARRRQATTATASHTSEPIGCSSRSGCSRSRVSSPGAVGPRRLVRMSTSEQRRRRRLNASRVARVAARGALGRQGLGCRSRSTHPGDGAGCRSRCRRSPL